MWLCLDWPTLLPEPQQVVKTAWCRLTAESDERTAAGKSGHETPVPESVGIRPRGNRSPRRIGSLGIQGIESTPSCGGRRGEASEKPGE